MQSDIQCLPGQGITMKLERLLKSDIIKAFRSITVRFQRTRMGMNVLMIISINFKSA